MSRIAPRGFRWLYLVAALLLAVLPQLARPLGVSAAAGLNINKAVCDVTTSTTGCPAGTTATSVNNARPGDVIQYNLNYSYTGGGASQPVTITLSDTLPGQQTYLSCNAIAGPAATCMINGNQLTVTITTTTDAGGAVAGTVAVQSQLNAGFNSAVTNNFTASAAGAAGAVATTPASNSVTVSPAAGGPGPGALTIYKEVRDVTQGQNYSTATGANNGDLIRYRITVTNGSGNTYSNVTVSDQLNGGQAFSSGSCVPSCTSSGNTYTFNVGQVNPGQQVVLYLDAFVTANAPGTPITNTAVLSATGFPTTNSNTTTVTVNGAGGGTGGCGAYGCGGCGYYSCGGCTTSCNPGYYYPGSYYYGGNVQICGVVSAWSPAAGSAYGYMTINGETFTLLPYMVASGGTINIGQNYCLTLTVNSNGCVTAVVVSPNLPAVNYICGAVSQYQSGYYPTGWYPPYAGYNPNYNWSNYGSYPSNGYYGWNGPMVIGGYPFQVQQGAYFPYQVGYGNPYCFMMNGGGYIGGSLSAVPVAAAPAQAAAGVHRAGRSMAL